MVLQHTKFQWDRVVVDAPSLVQALSILYEGPCPPGWGCKVLNDLRSLLPINDRLSCTDDLKSACPGAPLLGLHYIVPADVLILPSVTTGNLKIHT